MTSLEKLAFVSALAAVARRFPEKADDIAALAFPAETFELNPPVVPISYDLAYEEKEDWNNNRKIDALKSYRARTRLSLQASKAAFNHWDDKYPYMGWDYNIHNWVVMQMANKKPGFDLR